MRWNLMELRWLEGLHDLLACRFLDGLMPIVSLPGNGGWGFILLAAVLLAIPKTRKYGCTMALALVLDVFLVNLLLKPLAGRARPYDLGISYPLLVHAPGDFSFPSGHTAAAFAAAISLLPAGKRIWVPMTIYAALMGLSRIYLMVHYPTDVFAGAVCGALCGLTAVWLSSHWKTGRLSRWNK